MILVLIVVFGLSTYVVFAQILDIEIKGIPNSKGQICLAIFTNETDFKSEKAFWSTIVVKKDMVNGCLKKVIPFNPGKYGLTLLDDEDADNKMDFTMLGIPKEGFGFSNYYHKGLFRPAFDDFSFVLEKNETKKIIVRMKYY